MTASLPFVPQEPKHLPSRSGKGERADQAEKILRKFGANFTPLDSQIERAILQYK